MSDLFAWQGFSMPINEDWRPVALSGSYAKGYVRLEGEREDIVQIRWQSAKRVEELNKRALAYIGTLESAAGKRGERFKYNVDPQEDGSAHFEWHARHKGYGRIWHDPATSRIIMVERSGLKKDSFKRDARELWEAFEVHSEGLCPWSVFGLKVSLPVEYHLETCKFLPGRITLELQTKGARLIAERWSLAASLLNGKTLAQWAATASDVPDVVAEEADRVELRGVAGLVKRRLGWIVSALARHEGEANQILLVKSEHKPGHEPSWMWLP